MKNKEKAIFKDNIIKYCSESKFTTITNKHLSEHFKIDYNLIYALTEDLIYKGYLQNQGGITSFGDYAEFDMILVVTPKGRYFLKYTGGAIADYKKKLQKSRALQQFRSDKLQSLKPHESQQQIHT